MTFQITQGDLFDPAHNFDALAQGVNTFGLMGAGIAVPFREKFPEMYTEYRDLCKRHGETLAGLIHIFEPSPTLSYVDEQNQIASFDFGPSIYNLFSQIAPGPNADYLLLRTSTILMAQDAYNNGYDKVGLPWIGCGIGGLKRHNVQHIFEQILGDHDTEFVLVEQ